MTIRGNEANRFIQRGDHLLEVKRPAEAINEFEKALGLSPEDAVILCHLSRAFMLLGDQDRSLDYAGKAIAADPSEEWGFRLQAFAYLNKDKRTSAYKSATRALQVAPENIECLSTLARCALRIERAEEAKMLGEMLVSQAPESTYGHRILGDVGAAREDLPTAGKHYEKVMELDPNDDNVMELLASIRNAHNKFGDSVSLLRGAVSVDRTRVVRHSSLRDWMARFALFGHANERRKSVAGLLATMFFAYFLLAFTVNGIFGPLPWFGIAFVLGPPIIVLGGIPILRARFLASQSSQLHNLYQSMSREKRRRSLLAALVIVATAYGIAGLVYLDAGDPTVFYSPFAILMTVLWVYMLAIALRLFTLWLSDTWTRLMGTDRVAEESGMPLTMMVLPIIAFAALVAGLRYGHNGAWLAFFVGTVVSAIVYFRRYPVATGVFAVVAGVGILLFDVITQSPAEDPALGELGLIVAAVGAIGLLFQGYQEFQKYWQRRRIGKLLGNRRMQAEAVE